MESYLISYIGDADEIDDEVLVAYVTLDYCSCTLYCTRNPDQDMQTGHCPVCISCPGAITDLARICSEKTGWYRTCTICLTVYCKPIESCSQLT